MKKQFNVIKILFLTTVLSLRLLAINQELYQRDEEYKDYPNWVDTPYDAAFYIANNYEKLSKKDGYIKQLPIISEDEIEQIKNAKKMDEITPSNQNK